MTAPSEAAHGTTNILQVSGTVDLAHLDTELHLADGRILRIPTSLLTQETWQPRTTPSIEPESTVIPLIEEHLVVDKQVVETAKVRLHKSVQLYEETLNEPLAVRTYDIERVVLNQPVATAPQVRHEGDTTIYPLVEEQLILTKQLILKEEIRVTRRDTERLDTQVVTLRREHLTVEREPLT